MESLTIGVPKSIDVREKILKTLPVDVAENISIVDDTNSFTDNYIKLSFDSCEKLYINSHLVSSVADYIIENYEHKIINKILNSEHFYLSQLERKEVMKDIIEVTTSDDYNNDLNEMFCRRRREIIEYSLLEYLKNSNTLFLEGFVRFRLSDYWNELEDMIYGCVERYLMGKEYEDFVSLLKYFVDSQTSKVVALNIVATSDGKYEFYDHIKKDITQECMMNFQSEIALDEINYDDLLVSTLVVLAPKKIFWHRTENVSNKKLLDTVSKVFGSRVKFCKSCELCNKN